MNGSKEVKFNSDKFLQFLCSIPMATVQFSSSSYSWKPEFAVCAEFEFFSAI